MQRFYRHKPIEIEAMQFQGFIEEPGMIDKEFSEFVGDAVWMISSDLFEPEKRHLCVSNGGRGASLQPGDWLIKRDGEFYSCSTDYLEANYEAIDPAEVLQIKLGDGK